MGERLTGDDIQMLESLYKNSETKEGKTILVLLLEIQRARQEKNQFSSALGRDLTRLEKRARVNGE